MSNISNIKKIDLYDKSGFYDKKKFAIFSNTTLIIIIFVISLIFIGYVIYSYYYKGINNLVQSNSSYYGQNILLYEPLFQQKVNTVKDCIDVCNNDLICDGITYNNNTQICMGTKNGQIRNETSEYSAWVKPPNTTTEIHTDFIKAILVGYTNTQRIIPAIKMANPYMIGNYCYSFNLIIYDFYKNYGYWRHIFHKGTSIQTGMILSYQSWENLVKEIPNQHVGVWIAPFSNNLRIAISTTSMSGRTYGSYSDAFIEQCENNECYITDVSGKWYDKSRIGDGSIPRLKLESNIEYFDQDLQNIPINTQFNITINLMNTIVEIYINGKMIKNMQLNGTPNFDNSNLYILNDKTVKCEITNLIYYPSTAKINDINQIIALKPETS